MPYVPRTPWAHHIRQADEDINLRPSTPKHGITDRYRLSIQFKRGPHLEDDDVEENSFPLSDFTLGSTRRAKGRPKFLAGFGSDATAEHSRVSFNFSRRWLYIYAIPMTFNDTPPVFLPLEAEIPFEDIVTSGIRVARKKIEGGYAVTLTVTTRRPGRFYAQVKDKNIMRRATARDFVFSPSAKESTEGRSVQVMQQEGIIIHEGHAGPIPSISDEPFAVPVQAWLSWQFEFRLDAAGVQRFRRKLIDLNICGREEGQDLLGPNLKMGHAKDMLAVEMAHVKNIPALSKRSFEVRYLVEGLVSYGLVVPSEIPELLKELDVICRNNRDLKVRVLTSLFNEERIHNLKAIVFVRSKQLRGRKDVSDDKLASFYRCTVTPTRICLNPPELATSNEALRQHNKFRDRFLRVTFMDEGDRIQINPTIIGADEQAPHLGTLARVRRALNCGLEIAGRHYVFLAYGASSAREHSCWFVAEDPENGFTAEAVGNKLGFGQIKDTNVAKHAARMGIPFSSTRPVNVQLNVLSKMPDLFHIVKRKDGSVDKICFTDGVGICGTGVAREAAKSFGIKDSAIPSAIQIRCGGIKGVLGVWPTLCNAEDVRFRHSQIKFGTDPKTMQFGLNVVRTAEFRRATLNRQFIIILDHLGVPMPVFKELFLEAIIKIREIPLRMKNGQPTGNDMRLTRSMPNVKLIDMLEAGFNQDPLFVDLIKVLETHQLHRLKWKNRLELKDGVCLMGIADELGMLNEGEVFCQYSNPNEPEVGPVVVTGECAIMRAPSLHPGDIRTVRAVDHPDLRHLCNVVVFSVKGKPLPDQLSGGDLDGDDYTLIWDKRLLPRMVVKSANYTAPKPFNFFLDYIKNDILGQVSNAHLAHADREPKGPSSLICLELARQASLAVDFAKTGVPAGMPPEMRPKQWPTFMGKDISKAARHNYTSRQVLGVLFDLVHPDPVFMPTDFRLIPDEEKRDSRLAQYKIPPSILDDAFKLKQDYDTTILGLMARYRITEAEVVAGVVLRNPKRRGGRDGDLKEAVEHNYRALRGVVVEHVTEFLASRKFKGAVSPLQIYAIAAYQVTYVDEVREATEKRLGIKGVLAELLDVEEEEEESEAKADGAKTGEAQAGEAQAGDAKADDRPSKPSATTSETKSATEAGPDSSAHPGATAPSETNSTSPAEAKAESTTDAASTSSHAADVSPGPAPLLSFPWVFLRELCDLPNVRGSGPVITVPVPTKQANKAAVAVTSDGQAATAPRRRGNGHAVANANRVSNNTSQPNGSGKRQPSPQSPISPCSNIHPSRQTLFNGARANGGNGASRVNNHGRSHQHNGGWHGGQGTSQFRTSRERMEAYDDDKTAYDALSEADGWGPPSTARSEAGVRSGHAQQSKSGSWSQSSGWGKGSVETSSSGSRPAALGTRGGSRPPESPRSMQSNGSRKSNYSKSSRLGDMDGITAGLGDVHLNGNGKAKGNGNSKCNDKGSGNANVGGYRCRGPLPSQTDAFMIALHDGTAPTRVYEEHWDGGGWDNGGLGNGGDAWVNGATGRRNIGPTPTQVRKPKPWELDPHPSGW
ncbi:hypothetical protein CspHIS471_0308870 [Cutaneotrichosporon sp. HIS471]|nr:hypothetical protein CspHIS471_0308870 [Cutaneotrichosporon sp. HIS471]